MPRWKRIPFALSLALFYACMATPLLFVADEKSRVLDAAADLNVLELVGLVLAWGGVIMEAVADGHKSWVKAAARKRGNADVSKTFVGPTGGIYGVVRHPNYFGEVVFWTGLAVTAIPSLGKSVLGWTCSTLGLTGIVGLMKKSTASLVAKQETKYAGQPKFELWKRQVPYPWIPFVKSSPASGRKTS